jgi:ubiquinone biosynthesis protein UbiJ
VTVSYLDEDPSGLPQMLGQLIEQNLARDPSRRRLLRRATIVIEAVDAEVAATLRVSHDGIAIAWGEDGHPDITVRADGRALLDLLAVRQRFGFADPLTREGRAILWDTARGEIRVRPLIRRLPALRRLTMLLSPH